jgi:hypothetical protein
MWSWGSGLWVNGSLQIMQCWQVPPRSLWRGHLPDQADHRIGQVGLGQERYPVRQVVRPGTFPPRGDDDPDPGQRSWIVRASLCLITCAILTEMSSSRSSWPALTLSWSRAWIFSRCNTSRRLEADTDLKWVLSRYDRSGASDAPEACRGSVRISQPSVRGFFKPAMAGYPPLASPCL